LNIVDRKALDVMDIGRFEIEPVTSLCGISARARNDCEEVGEIDELDIRYLDCGGHTVSPFDATHVATIDAKFSSGESVVARTGAALRPAPACIGARSGTPTGSDYNTKAYSPSRVKSPCRKLEHMLGDPALGAWQ
jgi:hypothetical protein